MSLRRGLIWNYSAIYGGSIYFMMSVRDLSERWNSLERESAIIFSVPLMYW